MPDPAILALMIPIIAVTGGLLVAIISQLMQPVKIRARQHAQDEARKSYERLAMQKLDVIKTAVTMGYKKDEIAELDSRLEQVIGSDRLKALLNDKAAAPLPDTDLMDTDLLSEMDRLREKTRIKV